MTDADRQTHEPHAEDEADSVESGAPETAVGESGEDSHDDDVLVFDPSDANVAPEDAVSASLRAALEQMREEADQIAALGTGDEQVKRAERFVEAAGGLDEEIGSAARAEDGPDR